MCSKVGTVGNVGQFRSFFLFTIYIEKSLKLPHDPLLAHLRCPRVMSRVPAPSLPGAGAGCAGRPRS
jgi:hypothetical protein